MVPVEGEDTLTPLKKMVRQARLKEFARLVILKVLYLNLPDKLVGLNLYLEMPMMSVHMDLKQTDQL